MRVLTIQFHLLSYRYKHKKERYTRCLAYVILESMYNNRFFNNKVHSKRPSSKEKECLVE